MEQKKLLDYAAYGAQTKANEFDKKAGKATSPIKSKLFDDLADSCRADCKEIQEMMKE